MQFAAFSLRLYFQTSLLITFLIVLLLKSRFYLFEWDLFTSDSYGFFKSYIRIYRKSGEFGFFAQYDIIFVRHVV